MSSDPYREWDSAYVLGALSVEERLEFERHLESCDACTKSVGELAGIPGILGRLDAGEALAIRDGGAGGPAEHEPVPDPAREARVLQGLARRERVRRRYWLAGAAAACLLGVGAGFGWATATEGGGERPDPIAMEPVGSSHMSADLSVADQPWGTRLDWSCQYGHGWGARLAAGRTYELVITEGGGTERVVATWKATGGSSEHLAASSHARLDEIRSVDIRLAGSDHPLAEAAL